VSIIRNGNGLALLTANLLVLAIGDPALAGEIRRIQTANLASMPPTRVA